MATTNFVSGTVVEASWLNDVDAAVYETVPRIGRHIAEFGAVGDGTTDDLTPLTNFFNSAIANPGVPHYLGNATYATSAALPTINVSGVRIYGSGPTSVSDVGTMQCTTIKKIGSAGGTLLTVAPNTGASAQRLEAIVIEGVNFNGGQLAARGLLVQSVRGGTFNVYAEEFTTAGIELGVVSTLGEARDLQNNNIRISGRNQYTTAPILLLNGDSGANVSLNRFEIVDVSHKDGTAIVCVNPDNNIWDYVRVYRNAGGTATNSIEWRGGATLALATRAETYNKLTCTVAAIAKGTGTYTVAAQDISIKTLDLENGSPVPTIETGASVAGVWISWTPTITSGSGTLTTTSSVAKYKIDPNDLKTVRIRLAITVTTNGTGATNIQATLPFTTANDSISVILPGYQTTSGLMVRAIANVNTTTLFCTYYDGTYPAADNRTIIVDGLYTKV